MMNNIEKFKKVVYWEDNVEFDIEFLMVNTSEDHITDFKSTSNYNPKAGDAIYFLPGCKIPRIKIKKYYDKFNVKGTNNINKANVVIYGSKTIEEYFLKKSFYKLQKQEFISFIIWANTKGLISNEKLSKISKDIEDTFSDYILTNWIGSKILSGINNFNDYKYKPKNNSIEYVFHEYVRCEHWELAEKLLNENNNYYYQDSILKELNESVIDLEMYNTLCNMFESNDSQNHIVAMETMANCDYEKSAVYILLLIYNNATSIRNSNTKYHINFQSLLDFFEIQKLYLRLSLDRIVEILKNKNLLTQSNVDILLPLATNEIESLSYHTNFKIAKVEFSPQDFETNEEIEFDEDIFQTLNGTD
jgi:hypothetical protein